MQTFRSWLTWMTGVRRRVRGRESEKNECAKRAKSGLVPQLYYPSLSNAPNPACVFQNSWRVFEPKNSSGLFSGAFLWFWKVFLEAPYFLPIFLIIVHRYSHIPKLQGSPGRGLYVHVQALNWTHMSVYWPDTVAPSYYHSNTMSWYNCSMFFFDGMLTFLWSKSRIQWLPRNWARSCQPLCRNQWPDVLTVSHISFAEKFNSECHIPGCVYLWNDGGREEKLLGRGGGEVTWRALQLRAYRAIQGNVPRGRFSNICSL